MANGPSGTFLQYVDGNPQLSGPVHLTVSVGGGPARLLLMDTGSLGIVVPRETISDFTPIGNPTTFGYSSSGNQYHGQWGWATVQVEGSNGESFTTAPIQVFGVDGDDSGVGMMGIGIRGLDQDSANTRNAFLNLPGMKSGAMRTGYILSRFGVTFGYTQADLETFATFSTDCAEGGTPTATATLAPPAGSALRPYTSTGSFLLDTGLQYMIVTPRKTDPPPDPGYQTTVQVPPPGKPHEQFIPGVAVSVALQPQDGPSRTFWSFETGDERPGAPAYVRFAVPSAPGIVNTGIHLLEAYDYVADVRFDPQGQAAPAGTIGLRPVGE